MDEKLAKIRQYARAKGTFTAPQLQLDTCMGYITVAHALEALLREGSVSFDGKRYTWIRPDMSGRERELRIQMLEDSIAKIDEQNRRLAEQFGAEFGDDGDSSDDDDDDTDDETDDELFADDEDDELEQFIAEMNLSAEDDDDDSAGRPRLCTAYGRARRRSGFNAMSKIPSPQCTTTARRTVLFPLSRR